MLKRPAASRLSAVHIGVTHITRPRAWLLTVIFLTSIAVLPLLDCLGPGGAEIGKTLRGATGGIRDAWSSGTGFFGKIRAANDRTLAAFGEIETAVEDQSLLARHVRPPLQDALLRVGAGNENAYPGRAGWLFYRPEIDYLLARTFAVEPQPPERAIAEFAAALARRGIALVLVPVPGKPLIHPEKFSGRTVAAPPQNPEWTAFLSRLDAACRALSAPPPMVVDPTASLWEARSGGPQFLRTDSHWRPEAMQRAAALVADAVKPLLGRTESPGYRREARILHGRGDTAGMLRLREDSPWNGTEEVTIQRVVLPDGSPWLPHKDGPVLVLGDSFANIYSQDGLGWGNGAGFAEQLSVDLGVPVDALTRNDGGASATRKVLANELARGNDRLAGKKVVVWEFAMRELAVGAWISTPLPEIAAKPSGFLVLEKGTRQRVEGVIKAMGPIPKPGQTPYKDYLTAFHLTEISGAPEAGAIVLVPTMRNHTLTPAAALTPGQRVTLDLESWADVEDKVGGLNRGDLDDIELQIQEPNFGTYQP